MPCTTILVGKKASFDGSTIVARNEDSLEMLNVLIDGKRLKDISDLPLDLTV